MFVTCIALTGCRQKVEQPADNDVEEVYICESTTAYSYHFDPNCLGLQKCTHSISKTTLISAKKQGRKFCGWEVDNTVPISTDLDLDR